MNKTTNDIEDMEYERWRDLLGKEMREAIDDGDITEAEAERMSLMEQEDWLNERRTRKYGNFK